VYARIEEFNVPEMASSGETVNASVKVGNEETLGSSVLCQIWDDEDQLLFSQEVWINGGATHVFETQFTMPNRDYTVRALTWYYTGEWVFEDDEYRTIALVPWWCEYAPRICEIWRRFKSRALTLIRRRRILVAPSPKG